MSDRDRTITILCAVYYCLGRRKEYTKSVCDTLTEEWNIIPMNDKKALLGKIREYTRSNECISLELIMWSRILNLGIRDKLILK